MLEIPPELPLPAACPQCGAEWIGFGSGGDETEIRLACANWHEHMQLMSAEEVMALPLAVAPEQLLSRAMWRVGDDHPISDDPHMRLSPAFAEPGSHVSNQRRCLCRRIDRAGSCLDSSRRFVTLGEPVPNPSRRILGAQARSTTRTFRDLTLEVQRRLAFLAVPSGGKDVPIAHRSHS
jgi:hypothetical protein